MGKMKETLGDDPVAIQTAELKRVSEAIAGDVLAFCQERLATQRPFFYMQELNAWVLARQHSIAPDSPGRILRDLRAAGKVEYVLVSRSDSQYRVTRA